MWKEVEELGSARDSQITEELKCLARGPNKVFTKYKRYLVNGFRFHTREIDRNRKTQNSGVLVKGHELIGSKEIYGVSNDIIELHYKGGNKVVVFKYHWWDVYHDGGYKEDKYGCITINTKYFLNTNELYILACRAEQIYHAKDNKDPN